LAYKEEKGQASDPIGRKRRAEKRNWDQVSNPSKLFIETALAAKQGYNGKGSTNWNAENFPRGIDLRGQIDGEE